MLDPLSLSIPLHDVGSTPIAPAVVRPTRKLLTPSPTHPDDYILEIDYSSFSEFTRCARAAENLLVRSRGAAGDGSATSFGDLFHRCEALRLQHGLTPEVISRQHELVAEHFLKFHPAPQDHRTASRMIDTLKLYNERYSADQWPERVLRDGDTHYVERPFKVPLCTIEVNGRLPYPREVLLAAWSKEQQWRPDIANVGCEQVAVRNIHIVFTGKIDVVLQEGGLIWVADHKTSSRGGAEFLLAFKLSLQTRGYVWAAQKILNQPVAGLILNALVLRPLTKTGVGTELSRHPFFYSPHLIEEFEDNIRSIMTDFVAMLVRGYFPQYARSFKSPCAGCAYQENCQLPMEQRAADLASDFYADVTWNPMHE